ncbi:peptidoglycan-binding domain-containing protein [Magnetospirillum aberrantis]|uniref:Peptidoglycan binding-like domain-containing protein n=1 Tax=Magnetospirillum aberrantis SpK TaxID=908842 RepID=A0A7C9UZL3_9PROT|nr:peptidoglycan-binding domain-containing protein [Magnetospirillum aberrantis]NFV80454.1 hypothetical protein [Magnetospirillum aberrantis SpK]
MPFAGRLLAVAFCLTSAAAYGADPAPPPSQDPLTTPSSPLYQPSPGIRAQVREVIAETPPTTVQPAPLPELTPNIPVPRGLVAVAQRELTALGYDPGPIDGRMGPMTRKALTAFQTDKGLPADGQLTFALLDKLMVRAVPKITPPPTPVPPPPPPVRQWTFRAVQGKSVHGAAGDLLGKIADFVLAADGQSVAAMVIKTTNGYGTHCGRALVPFDMVGHAVTRASVILPLPAGKALALRDKAQKIELKDGEKLLSTVLDDEDTDATADTDGHVVALPAAK